MLRRSLPILLYHHVSPAQPGTHSSLTVSAERFARHLRTLARTRRAIVDLDTVIAWALDGRPLPPRPALITFDDGYADLAESAFPLLERHGMPALVFAVSGRVGQGNDWDGPASQTLLDAARMREWSRRGITFGAHTRTHPDLTRLAPDEAEREMAGSRADLEALLEQPVRSFAYPYGAADPVAHAIAAATFDVAFTADEGRNKPGVDRTALRRSMVQRGDGARQLVERLALGRSPTQLARQRAGELRASWRS